MDRVVYSLILNEPHGDGWRGRGGRSESEGNPVFSYIDLVLFFVHHTKCHLQLCYEHSVSIFLC